MAENSAPKMYVAYGLAGYGPELDEESEPYVGWDDIAAALSDECSRAADHADDTARALAADGDYESAWREHERAESLAILSANLAPSRASAPLYANDRPAWHATIARIVGDSFPVDVSPHERLYVWEAE